jgi:hypothetical protein
MADKFESLSDEALYALADKMGLDLPPELERVFVIEEILDAIEEDSVERRTTGVAPVRIEETKFSGSEMDGVDVCLDPPPAIEQCYNETSVRLLVRDPSWAFAFWEIAANEGLGLHDEEGHAGLFLRVFEMSDGELGEAKRESFDIPVSKDDSQWYINLPKPKSSYRIELCVRQEGKVRVLARSRSVAVPRQHLENLSSRLEPETAELLRLSGLETLDIEPVTDDNPQRILKAGLAGE